MHKKPKGPTFAEIVRHAVEHPAPPITDYSGVVDASGRRWREQKSQISPTRALELVLGGALVAWDPCGCGGYCGFEWSSAEEVACMVLAGKPEVRAHGDNVGNLSEWGTDEGAVLVVAENAVRWGKVIDG